MKQIVLSIPALNWDREIVETRPVWVGLKQIGTLHKFRSLPTKEWEAELDDYIVEVPAGWGFQPVECRYALIVNVSILDIEMFDRYRGNQVMVEPEPGYASLRLQKPRETKAFIEFGGGDAQ